MTPAPFRAAFKRLVTIAWLIWAGSLALCAQTNEPAAAFDAANKSYEQGRYQEAAEGYERLLQKSPGSETLLFNLGNAWFKAGQIGRAIAAWRHGQMLAPRDPNLRFNLEFARRSVSGSDLSPAPLWERALTALTLNEWTVLSAVALWIWFSLLALREARPLWRGALRGYTAATGLATLFLAGAIVASAQLRFGTTSVVVITSAAIARSGPLEESKVLQQFRDGTELTLLDEKELEVSGAKQKWFYVRDAASRTGWVRSDQVLVLGG